MIEAVNNKDVSNLREEMGDILLQVALHTAIAEDTSKVLYNWEEIKRQKKRKECFRKHCKGAKGIASKYES